VVVVVHSDSTSAIAPMRRERRMINLFVDSFLFLLFLLSIFCWAPFG